MHTRVPALLTILLIVPACTSAGKAQSPPSSANSEQHTTSFDTAADQALAAMRTRADELKIGGVAVVAYFEGDTIQSWSSKMVVVGRYKDDPKANDKGSNLLAIAYAKAAEMADTHKNSGSQLRPPMIGEFGWQGGVIEHGRSGYLIAAFSGGKSEDDVEVSRAGMLKLKSNF